MDIITLLGDPETYRAYKDNIAMAFKDEFHRYYKIEYGEKPTISEDVHIIANTAADNFLKLLTKKDG